MPAEPTPTVHQVAPLLALIRKHEAGSKGYDAVWGKIDARHRPATPITGWTIGEVLGWQDSIDHLYMSEAAGAYQFLEDTLRSIFGPAGFTTKSMFDVRTQDALAVHLLKGAKLVNFLRGEISAEDFATRISRVWASFPVATDVVRTDGERSWTVRKGSSYYSGDGLNKALVEVDDVLGILYAIRPRPTVSTPHRRPTTPTPTPAPTSALQRWLARLWDSLQFWR